MINVSCYNCGCVKAEPYASENGFNLMKCSSCGLLYVNPRPDDEEVATATTLGVHPGEHNLDMRGGFTSLKYKRYLKILPGLYGNELKRTDSRWLDVGCGYGEFLMALMSFSDGKVHVKGLEPMLAKREHARAHDWDVTDFDLSSHEETYDFVSLLNVFSHLPNPPQFLTMISRLLKPKGEILIQTGDTANLSAADQERPLYLPSHLSFVSEEILTDILKKCGYRIVSVKKYPEYDAAWLLMSAVKELAKYCIPGRRGNLEKVIRMYHFCRKFKSDMFVRAALGR